jgi:glycosyltransferase involved in cell wall biosynthesis
VPTEVPPQAGRQPEGPSAPDVVLFGGRTPLLRERTRRATSARFVSAAERDEPVFFVRAGAVPSGDLRPLPASATGRPLVAHGEGFHCLYVERPVPFARDLERTGSIEAACERAGERARVVRVHALDATFSHGLRAIVAVTTLHRGGAERIAIDLVSGLRERGHDVVLAVLDRSIRSTYAAPPDTVFLQDAGNRGARIDALVDLARAHAADVVHAHLLDGDEVERLVLARIPVVVTAHNSPPGWPARWGAGSRGVAMAIGCSRDVTRALAESGLPARTIWNGIAPRTPSMRSSGTALRLLTVANHRPQKRLDRLPAIVADLRARGTDAHLVIAGEPVNGDPASARIRSSVEEEAMLLDVHDAIQLVPSTADPGALYRKADVVVSTSEFEGLSLVHLEALAEGVPLVTTPVAGAAEIVAKHPHARIAAPEGLAGAIEEVRGKSGRLAPDFEVAKMIERHEDLLVRAALPRPSRRDGLVLVTNNFATGGAQSSARRLLLALAAAGVRVSAVVLEEQATHPTAGRTALARAGIPSSSLPARACMIRW